MQAAHELGDQELQRAGRTVVASCGAAIGADGGPLALQRRRREGDRLRRPRHVAGGAPLVLLLLVAAAAAGVWAGVGAHRGRGVTVCDLPALGSHDAVLLLLDRGSSTRPGRRCGLLLASRCRRGGHSRGGCVLQLYDHGC